MPYLTSTALRKVEAFREAALSYGNDNCTSREDYERRKNKCDEEENRLLLYISHLLTKIQYLQRRLNKHEQE